MILYYAMGGGLGHLTRTIAILQHAPRLCRRVRILSASNHARLCNSVSPCPIDRVPDSLLSSRRNYFSFLDSYIHRYRVSSIVLDTFYHGIAGEWLEVGNSIPKMLIARYLNWEAYKDRTMSRCDHMPFRSLAIESLEPGYRKFLENNTETTHLEAPIVVTGASTCGFEIDPNAVAVVHTGLEEERRILKSIAVDYANRHGIKHIHEYYPEMNVFPLTERLEGYKHIVSAAGYNSCAFSRLYPVECTLHPFRRRYDNQFARIDALKSTAMRNDGVNGAEIAAQWILSAH